MRTSNPRLTLLASIALLWIGCTTPPPQDPVVPVSASVKSFTASPTAIEPGDGVVLSWEVADAQSVTITRLSGEPLELPDPTPALGSVTVQVTESTVFVLTARGEGGSDSASTSVVVHGPNATPPLCTVFPGEISAGETATLVWNIPGASQVSITDDTGATAYAGPNSQGSTTVSPFFNTTFTCSDGTRTSTAGLVVRPKIVGFEADVSNAAPGAPLNLHWQVGGARQVTLSAVGRGVLSSVDTPADIADGTFIDTVPIALPEDGLVQYVLEAVSDSSTETRTIEVYVGADPKFVNSAIPQYALEGGFLFVSWTTVGADNVTVFMDGQPIYTAPTPAAAKQGFASIASPTSDLEVEVRATNVRGGVASQTRVVSPVGVPTLLDFSASPTTVAHGGEPVTLSWNVPNARNVSVRIKGGRVLATVTGRAAETGSVQAFPNALTQYEVLADNAVGINLLGQSPLSVDVTTPAVLTFSPNTGVQLGAPITVTGSTVVNGGAIQGLPNIVRNTPGAAFVDISTTGVATRYRSADIDQFPMSVTLPETFNTVIYGQKVSSNQLNLSINGWFRFGASFTGPNTPVPFPTNTLVPLAIAPFWADLIDTTAGDIYYQFDTVNQERRLILQWDKEQYTPIAGSQVTFQVQLYQSGKMVFAYKTLQGLVGAPVSIGVSNVDQTDAVYATTVPNEGDTFTLFGATLPPVTMKANANPYYARVAVGQGDYLEVSGTPVIIP
jgi:hypothetical protein